jgi:hypothetical protein
MIMPAIVPAIVLDAPRESPYNADRFSLVTAVNIEVRFIPDGG